MALEELHRMIGREHPLVEVPMALERYARRLGPIVTGAYLIGCSDESEKEGRIAFYDHLVRRALPELKYSRRSAFKTTNLGARYEIGAVAIAEDHFATEAAMNGFKVMVIKLSSHVSVHGEGADRSYGRMSRYERDSIFCGALHALLDGVALPATAELRETFNTGGLDRVALLSDPAIVEPRVRPLLAAVVNARLQCARLSAEIEARVPSSPTVYVVASCVNLNRLDPDTELLCGVAVADSRAPDGPKVSYTGLGDDPRRYRITERPRLQIADA